MTSNKLSSQHKSIRIFDDEAHPSVLNVFRKRARFGLCCINNTLHPEKKRKNDVDIFCSRTVIRDRFTVERAQTLSTQNVKDLIPIIEWNRDHNIRHLRLSSDMFPRFTDYNYNKDLFKLTNNESYTIDHTSNDLKRAGDLANSIGHRITMHPGQHCVVGAKDQHKFDKTLHELEHHANILEQMGIDDSGILCIHGGGTYGDKESAIRRWVENFDDLPSKVKRRLCIENCEKSYSVRDCLTIAEQCKIPVILDSHHYNCFCHYNSDITQEPVEDMMDEIIDSWGNRTPVFHVSDQKQGAQVGAHHDYVQCIPGYMIDVCDTYNCDLHIEVEAKAKEKAIELLQKRYQM
jgi:UV DNA damage endonuclease